MVDELGTWVVTRGLSHVEVDEVDASLVLVGGEGGKHRDVIDCDGVAKGAVGVAVTGICCVDVGELVTGGGCRHFRLSGAGEFLGH